LSWKHIGGAAAICLFAAIPVEARVQYVATSACDSAVAGVCAEQRTTVPQGSIRVAHMNSTQSAIVGAALGAIVAGSIISATDQHSHKSGSHSKNWWSPKPGVKCYDRDAVCYHDDNFSAKWTRREYGY
jgi:hypothetical protein